jgi:hypothetical protein
MGDDNVNQEERMLFLLMISGSGVIDMLAPSGCGRGSPIGYSTRNRNRKLVVDREARKAASRCEKKHRVVSISLPRTGLDSMKPFTRQGLGTRVLQSPATVPRVRLGHFAVRPTHLDFLELAVEAREHLVEFPADTVVTKSLDDPGPTSLIDVCRAVADAAKSRAGKQTEADRVAEGADGLRARGCETCHGMNLLHCQTAMTGQP